MTFLFTDTIPESHSRYRLQLFYTKGTARCAVRDARTVPDRTHYQGPDNLVEIKHAWYESACNEYHVQKYRLTWRER